LARFEVVCVDPRWKGKGDDLAFPHDSALVRISEGGPPSESLVSSGRRLRPGDPVSVWGYPLGSVLFESRAKVTGVSDMWIRILQEVGAPAVSGHSGSPVLEASGEVVGILVGGRIGVGEAGSVLPIGDAELGCPRP
jgi:S1-C subfamily serine protease